jgi:hypothetical protein
MIDLRWKNLLLFVIVSLCSACAQPKQLYNFGDYNDSYYKHKKKSTPETRQALIKSIEKAIGEENKSLSGRVPPGMYANLGYMYLQDGNTQKAISLFEKEKETYPESVHFMDRLIVKVEKTEQREIQQ